MFSILLAHVFIYVFNLHCQHENVLDPESQVHAYCHVWPISYLTEFRQHVDICIEEAVKLDPANERFPLIAWDNAKFQCSTKYFWGPS